MHIGISLGINAQLRGGGFSPASLFANGEQGVWYAPSPDTCFTDTTGTTPAGAGDAVALMLDKSQGAGYKNGGFTGLGPEQYGDDAQLAGGGFVDNGDQTYTHIGTNLGGVNIARTSLVENKAYSVKCLFSAPDGGELKIQAGGSAGDQISFLTGPHISVVVVARDVSAINAMRFLSKDDNVTISNISVRELPGNHATQPTAAARPILARVPEGGRRNLLTRTEGPFSSLPWSVHGTIGTTALGGGITRVTFGELTGSAKRLRQDYSVAPSSTHTGSFYVRATGANVGKTARLILVRTGSGGLVVSIDTIVLTAEFQRIDTTLTIGPDNNEVSFRIEQVSINDASEIEVKGIQLEEGSTATPYQRVGSTYDVTEAGKADKWHLVFDGVDDFMQTPSIDFTGTDEMSVFAGVRKLSDDAAGIIVECENAPGSENVFSLSFPASVGGLDTARITHRGSGSYISANSGSIPAPTSRVLTGLASLSLPKVSISVDGVTETVNAASAGTGGYDSRSLTIGARVVTGSSALFNGHLYSLIVRGKLTDAATIDKTEAYVAGKTGIEAASEATWDSATDTYTQNLTGLGI